MPPRALNEQAPSVLMMLTPLPARLIACAPFAGCDAHLTKPTRGMNESRKPANLLPKGASRARGRHTGHSSTSATPSTGPVLTRPLRILWPYLAGNQIAHCGRADPPAASAGWPTSVCLGWCWKWIVDATRHHEPHPGVAGRAVRTVCSSSTA